MGELLAVLALLLFSLNIIVTKIGSSRINRSSGFFIAMVVNVGFGFILLSVQLILREAPLEWNTAGFLTFIGAGFFSTYVGRRLFFETIAKLGPAKASTFQMSNPLFTLVIAYLFLGETLNGTTLFAVAIVLIGLFLTSYTPKAPEKLSLISRADSLLTLKGLLFSGIGLALISGLSYAFGNILRGLAVREWNEPILGSMIGAALGVVIQLFTDKQARGAFKGIRNMDRIGVSAYIASGLLTISAQAAVIAAMIYIPVSVANLITLATPIIVTPVSYFLFKNQEGITIWTIAGIALVLSGIGIIVGIG